MDSLFLLIPLSVALVLAIGAVLAWAVLGGQFEDLEAEGRRVLDDEPDPPTRPDAPFAHDDDPADDGRPSDDPASAVADASGEATRRADRAR